MEMILALIVLGVIFYFIWIVIKTMKKAFKKWGKLAVLGYSLLFTASIVFGIFGMPIIKAVFYPGVDKSMLQIILGG